ncbi:hypothetical protein [Methylosinus sporium]|nr:hypothetical protein [Methylosinus sporium]
MKEISGRKIAGVFVALALGVAPIVTAAPAAAGDPGAAIAAGIGGFALGALAGSSAARPAPPPYYGAPAYYPAPVYEAPPPYRCWRERRPVFDEYGVVIGYRPTRVCE